MKKTLVRVLSFFIMFTVMSAIMFGLAACSKDGTKKAGTEGEPVTLNFWHPYVSTGDTRTVSFQKAVDDWNKSNPNAKVVTDALDGETLKSKLKTAIAANEAPELFFSLGAGFLKPFVDAGKVLALDDYLKDGTLEKIELSCLTGCTFDGKIYALPADMMFICFYCNTELFDKYGLKIPETHQELLEVIKAFREKGVTPMTVGVKDRWPAMLYQNIYAAQLMGVKGIMDCLEKRASFDTPEFVKSAALVRELIDAGAIDQGDMGLSRDEVEERFLRGEIPMYYNGSWVAGRIESGEYPVKGKIVAKKYPAIEGAKYPKNYQGGVWDVFCVNANLKNPDVAVSALKFIDYHYVKNLYEAGAGIPSWKLENPDESKVNKLTKQMMEFTKEGDNFIAWDVILVGEDAQNHLDLVQELFVGTITPENFAKEMQKRLNEK
ncbi:MAG TPA: extracellular solute-binding protein [Clostridiaceae bacterium]|nr:extracellular solute-binding protein [Clostridiaceae bacterium]